MNIKTNHLSGLIILEPNKFADERGYFYELFQKERYESFGIPPFVQDNVSRSKQGVVRGLHYQSAQMAQGKLVGVLRGVVWDVVVDIRVNSNTFGQWFGIILNDKDHTQMYVPPGFAHGFCVLSEEADFYYKCTGFYTPKAERGIIWNDLTLNIPWPVNAPIVSAKDKLLPKFSEILHEELFL
jgi:dTDP-4-dehydrorhamnose 3,5-epimerase